MKQLAVIYIILLAKIESWFGISDVFFKTLMLLLVADVVTGLYASYVESHKQDRRWLSSNKWSRGVIRGIVYFCLFSIHLWVKEDHEQWANGVYFTLTVGAIVNELLSIGENAERGGIKLPFLEKVMKIMKR